MTQRYFEEDKFDICGLSATRKVPVDTLKRSLLPLPLKSCSTLTIRETSVGDLSINFAYITIFELFTKYRFGHNRGAP
jgi:hypothetical protein